LTNDEIRAEIAEKQTRLTAYKTRELTMLSNDGVKSYGIGSRRLERFETELGSVQKMIKTLENEIAALQGQLAGTGRRAARGVVPMDF